MNSSLRKALVVLALLLLLPQLTQFANLSRANRQVMYATELGKGLRLLDEGKTKYALDAFDKAASLAPSDQDAHFLIASILRDRGLYSTTASWLIKYASNQSQARVGPMSKQEKAALYVFLGDMYYHDLQNIQQAERMYRLAIEADPRNAVAYNNLGYMYAEHGIKLDESVKLIGRAMELQPNAGYIVDSLGWVYYQQGKIQEAIRVLQRAVLLEPNVAEIRIHLAKAYHASGQRKKANDQYRVAVTLLRQDARVRPSDLSTRTQLADALRAIGDQKSANIEQAKAAMLKSHHIGPT